jgi:hypothetical protein
MRVLSSTRRSCAAKLVGTRFTPVVAGTTGVWP